MRMVCFGGDSVTNDIVVPGALLPRSSERSCLPRRINRSRGHKPRGLQGRCGSLPCKRITPRFKKFACRASSYSGFVSVGETSACRRVPKLWDSSGPWSLIVRGRRRIAVLFMLERTVILERTAIAAGFRGLIPRTDRSAFSPPRPVSVWRIAAGHSCRADRIRLRSAAPGTRGRTG